MSEHGRDFDLAQRTYDAQEPPDEWYNEDEPDCDGCLWDRRGSCVHPDGRNFEDGICLNYQD